MEPLEFPQPYNPSSILKPDEGVTLRDWFAGQALIAVVGSSPATAVEDVCQGIRAGMLMANGAYALADAMLKARQA